MMTEPGSDVGATKAGEGLDIGFWFPRPDRGARLAEALRARGHAVTIYHSLPIPGDQANVVEVPYSLPEGVGILQQTTHQVYYTSRSLVPVVQLFVSRVLASKPYVYTINGAPWAYYHEAPSASLVGRLKPFAYPYALRLSLWGASSVVANSRFLADAIASQFRWVARKVTTIHNGFDLAPAEAGEGHPDAWPVDGTRVLSVVTTNFERKTDGVVLLLRAFQKLSERRPDATLLVAAKCDRPQVMAPVWECLEGLSCADRVRVELNRTDVPDLLAAADLFLYATPNDSSDSLPRVLLEAQAAGVPTVATDTTGCSEVIVDGETGRLAPYDDEAVASAALEMLEDPDAAQRMASEGQRTIHSRFKWEDMAEAYERLFLRAVAGRVNAPSGTGGQ